MFWRTKTPQLPSEVSSAVETFTGVLWARCFGIDPACWRHILEKQTQDTTTSGQTLFVCKLYRIPGLDAHLTVRFTFEKKENKWQLGTIALVDASIQKVCFTIYYNAEGNFLEYPSGAFPWEDRWGDIIDSWVSRTEIEDADNVIFRP